jgi:hypothetical protein
MAKKPKPDKAKAKYQVPKKELLPGDKGPSQGPDKFDSYSGSGRMRRQGGSGQAKRGG